ncbi:MAG: hypothetical protein JWO80_1895 [Bryobacterales bacterium]|nr:hypothetical protein [Bryobacterales bacterium]
MPYRAMPVDVDFENWEARHLFNFHVGCSLYGRDYTSNLLTLSLQGAQIISEDLDDNIGPCPNAFNQFLHSELDWLGERVGHRWNRRR